MLLNRFHTTICLIFKFCGVSRSLFFRGEVHCYAISYLTKIFKTSQRDVLGICVSPFLSVIDKCVTQVAATPEKKKNLPNLIFRNLTDYIMRPRQAFSAVSLWMVCAVYSATYSTANLCEVGCAEDDDVVIVTNADNINFTGKKWDQNIYRHHTGYPGGLREIVAKQQWQV